MSKENTHHITARIDSDFYAVLKQWAQEEHRTLAGQIQYTLESIIQDYIDMHQLKAAHQAVVQADHLYANDPTPHNNTLVLLTQRAYYHLAVRVAITTMPRPLATLHVANLLLKRARLNRARTPNDWSCNQVTRMVQMKLRASLDADDYLSEHPPTPLNIRRPRRTPPPPSHKGHHRIQHPITKRWLWVPDEEAYNA